MVDILDDVLAKLVLGMGLSGKDNLNRTLRVIEDLGQAAGIL